MKHLLRSSVAEVDVMASRAALGNALGAQLEADERNEFLLEQLCDELPHAAVSCKNHVALHIIRVRRGHLELLRVALFESLGDHRPGSRQPWRQRHRQCDHEVKVFSQALRHDGVSHALAEKNERELAAWSEEHRSAQAGEHTEAEQGASHDHDQALQPEQNCEPAEHPQAVIHKNARLHLHAHCHKEQSEQKPAERRNVALNLHDVLRLGNQQAGEESAERHAQASSLRDS
mmetsp:Transcript_4836/g.12635  ORF Transcript_4836/g.12635 Transcript_4836/m.12635 type:complete len:232 (-) Transcript_4836:2140-2835(-)